MLTLFYFFSFYIFSSSSVKGIRIGHLSSDAQETLDLVECTSNSSIELISLPSCDKFNGVENAAVLHHTHNVSAIIGVDCLDEAETVSRLAERWRILFLTTALTEELKETTATADPLNPRGFAGAISALAVAFGWKNLAIVCVQEQCEFHESLKKEISLFKGINVTSLEEMKGKQWKHRIASSTRVILFFLPSAEFPSAIFRFQREIPHSDEFVFALVELQREKAQIILENVKETLYEKEVQHKQVVKLLKRILIISWEHFDATRFSEHHPARRKALLLCETLHLLENEKYEESDELTKEKMANRQGDKVHGFLDGQMARVALIEPRTMNCSLESCLYHKVIKNAVWSTVADHLLVSEPECGYEGELCSYFLVYFCGGIIAFLIILPLAFLIRYQWKETKLLRMPWRVDHDQLSFKKEEDPHPGYRRISTASSTTEESGNHVAYLNNERISLKSYAQKRSVFFTRKEMERLNQLKFLSHVNVNSFVGISFNQNSSLVVMWSYCQRGSLDDMIFNNSRELRRDFRALFIKQCLRGLQYIHKSPIKVHGALFLHNCLVDNYWVVKLTDFGLAGILNHKMEQKEIVSQPSVDEHNMPKYFLQYPPEYLKTLTATGDPLTLQTTVAGDVYQLGMMLYQILLTRRPFRERQEETQEILEKVCDLQLESPFRPLVPEPTEFTLRLVSIMQQCWHSNPELRPQLFKVIDAVAREFATCEKGSPIDYMIKLIDEYSANLEEIVAEKTLALTELQERTEELLFRMIPRTVAEELRDGIEIRPRMHEGVALLVADMWRFSNLCNEFIPIQIVTILQQIYLQFDTILDKFPATKIDNVGDTYLVIAGIPKEPEHRQLQTVCQLALRFKEFIERFSSDFKPEYKIQMKFGLNCGNVASGVIGHKTPRFCVFGDAVAMAYRMSETSYPNRIQMSELMHVHVAEHFKKFSMTQRGIVDIKTKGPCTTYFLDADLETKAKALPMSV